MRQHWRSTVFAVSWLSYVAFYLCRKNFSVIMPILSTENGFSTSDLSHIVFGFSLAYAIGQFLMGVLADLLGARVTVPAGMALSAISVALMGFRSSAASMFGLQLVNGLAQATGWSGLSRIFRNSFTCGNRGVTMGWWTTNYVVGSFLATMLAAYAATGPWFPSLGWRRAVWTPALLLLAMAAVFRGTFRSSKAPADAPAPSGGPAYIIGVLGDRRIRLLAAVYLLVKFVRYSLLFWLPLFLTQYVRLGVGSAGYISGLFDFAGLGGVLAAGYLSDRVFSGRRFPVASTMLFALSALCLLPAIHAGGLWLSALEVALLGIVIYGPDTLLVGAATQDASSKSSAGAAAGIVDGFGSIGQLASPLVVSSIVDHSGWPAVFITLSVTACAAGVLLARVRTWEILTGEANSLGSPSVHAIEMGV